ncbi:MAG: DUF547 domain-containing protein [Alphaproteobacteria bacterium]|nr:DUF547 domain-containing protein [Alphaproteobacteria bacterium]
MSGQFVRRGLVRLSLGLCLVMALGGFQSLEALFAPKAELWPRWQAHDPKSTQSIDHGAWAGFLRRYLRPGTDGIARVAYGAVGGEDRARLDAYLAMLEAVPVDRLSRPEQRAFWINLYNAATVRLILDHPAAASIRDIDISPGLFADGPWGKKLLQVADVALSLNDVEHRILRPIWRDPRLHYAVNCAALGCPNLQAEAFTAANTERLLEAAARAYVNHPRGVMVDGQRLVVSSIYVWFQEDFEGTDRGVIRHLKRYAEAPLAAALGGVERIDGHAYDWRLNAVAGVSN